ncbi:PTS system glucose-specific IIBC component [Spiroplasma sabaudiense Ar-1343]|uniref:PTS system glucose-specific IIBC component n=1 Tax=Spiroplasma sabaudiense Ar-1343 TaxID=1276257 RepID=W6AB36_9MOLU|nr:PTS transporter subunit EIIC [Spiroplasma sabaudiense]AHI54196.1 PTS system glucose-specific IIBC component [Spiroplasma sabaudiense Ar-1343]
MANDKNVSTQVVDKELLKQQRQAKRAEKKAAFANTKFGKNWNQFKGASFSKLQNLARVIVFPIAVLPIAGLFLGIGGGFSAAAVSGNWGDGWVNFFNIMKSIGDVVFACLGVLFCTSVAFGFAKQSKGVAAVSAFIAYVVMSATMMALFLPTTNTAGDAVVQFDPWKLAGDNGLISVGTNKGMLKSVLGISPTLDLSVLGGIVVGWLMSIVHNKTYNIKVPRVLGFFGGEKFVPIAGFFLGVISGIALFFIWPGFLQLLYLIGTGLGSLMGVGGQEEYSRTAGALVAMFFGITERLLIPMGLHHVQYTPFWYTSAGGEWLTPVIDANNVITGWTMTSGAYPIFFEQMKWMGGNGWEMTDEAYRILEANDVWFKNFSDQLIQVGDTWKIAFNRTTNEVGTMFMSGRFAFMQYGYPFGAAAMIMLSKPENRKQSSGILISAAATSFLTGITEPILFSFLFVAPMLYLFDAFMAGISFMMAYLLNVTVGQGFAAGFIDWIFFGVIPGFSSGVATQGAPGYTIFGAWAGRTGALWIPIYGLAIMSPAYFFGFWAIIKAKDYKTPGREEVGEESVATQALKASLAKGTKAESQTAEKLLKALGGKANIIDIDHNKTELIIEVKDASKVSEGVVKTTGSKAMKVEG